MKRAASLEGPVRLVIALLTTLTIAGCFDAPDACEQLVRCAESIDRFDGQSSAPGFIQAVARSGNCYDADNRLTVRCERACDEQRRRMQTYAEVMGADTQDCAPAPSPEE